MQYVRLPLSQRKRYYAAVRAQAMREEPRQRQISFAQFERLARQVARLEASDPGGDVQL